MSVLQLRSRNVPRHYLTWADKLKNGLRRHRVARAIAEVRGGLQGAALHLAGPEDLINDDVANAIGTFWIGLLKQAQPVVLGYGPATLFERAGNPLPPGAVAAGVVPRSDTFILLLLLAENATDQYIKRQQNPKGPESIGHFLLLVASQTPGQPLLIRITIMNSLLGVMNGLGGVVQNAYTDLVTNSGWLGVDTQGNPLPRQPTFAAEVNLDVPDQQGINTCGLYTILNAWATMLNIPITAEKTKDEKIRRRVNRNWRSYRQFHTMAIEIINLAMAGHMDSETVQAFFNVYGYSKQVLHEEAAKPLAEQVRRVDAVRMIPGTLAEAILDQQELDQVSALGG